jgi:hypothetical protein
MAGFGAVTVSPSRTMICFSASSFRGPFSRGVILLAITHLSRVPFVETEFHGQRRPSVAEGQQSAGSARNLHVMSRP